MLGIAKRLLTPAEYLARERAAAIKSEYFRGEMFSVAGESYSHVLLVSNFTTVLNNTLREHGCHALPSDLRVKTVSTSFYTYPDIVVLCGSPEFEDAQSDTLLNPIAIVEVLSESSEAHDRGEKFNQYCRIETLKEYVLVAQNKPHVDQFIRMQDGQSWLFTQFKGLEATLNLGTIPVRIPLREIYLDVLFPPPAPLRHDERPDTSDRPED